MREIEKQPQTLSEHLSSKSEIIPDGVGVIEVSCGSHNEAMLKRMLPFRADFVEAMHWTPDESQQLFDFSKELPWLNELDERGRSDVDFYDTLNSTLHFMLTDHENGQIIAGLRLTRVPSVEESLSWSMFKGNSDIMQQAYSHTDGDGIGTLVKLNEAAQRGNVWDLTRLVNPVDGTVDIAKVMAGMMELFGTGYGAIRKQTSPEEQDEVRWIFNGTEMIKAALEHLQVQFDVVAQGQISKKDVDQNGNPVKSYFCMVKAESATQYIYDHANEREFVFPHEHLDNGLRKANAI